MESSMEVPDQGQEVPADQVMEAVGEPEGSGEQVESPKSDGQDPLYVQKRLKQQQRAHEREMRELQSRMDQMQSQQAPQQDQMAPAMQPQGGMDEQIHKAVSYALQHREMEERKAKDAERMQHVHKQYGELQKHLDHTADKYDDFDEIVRGQDAPFTNHMRDAALLLPRQGSGSAGEVLYKLGKNPEELHRISKLHPLDQAAEVVKLSHALIGGGESKSSQARPLGQIKSNPVTNSAAVTDKTPVSELRRRMKANWK